VGRPARKRAASGGGGARGALVVALLAVPCGAGAIELAKGSRIRSRRYAAAESLYTLRLRRGGPDACA